jgi:hypothetical protein
MLGNYTAWSGVDYTVRHNAVVFLRIYRQYFASKEEGEIPPPLLQTCTGISEEGMVEDMARYELDLESELQHIDWYLEEENRRDFESWKSHGLDGGIRSNEAGVPADMFENVRPKLHRSKPTGERGSGRSPFLSKGTEYEQGASHWALEEPQHKPWLVKSPMKSRVRFEQTVHVDPDYELDVNDWILEEPKSKKPIRVPSDIINYCNTVLEHPSLHEGNDRASDRELWEVETNTSCRIPAVAGDEVDGHDNVCHIAAAPVPGCIVNRDPKNDNQYDVEPDTQGSDGAYKGHPTRRQGKKHRIGLPADF